MVISGAVTPTKGNFTEFRDRSCIMQAGASFEKAIRLEWVRPVGAAANMGGAGARGAEQAGNADAPPELPSISADQDAAEGAGGAAPRHAVTLPYPRRAGRWILRASMEGGRAGKSPGQGGHPVDLCACLLASMEGGRAGGVPPIDLCACRLLLTQGLRQSLTHGRWAVPKVAQV